MGRRERQAKPKISGLFHNCAMNCALPTLLAQISLYAEDETREVSALPENTDMRQNYEVLKEAFAQYYRLSETAQSHFTWTVFDEFLKEYDFSALEILFAPVFRNVLKRFYQEESAHPENQSVWNQWASVLQDRAECQRLLNTDMQNTGRYLLLDYALVDTFFNRKFHILGELFRSNGKNTYEKHGNYYTQTELELTLLPRARPVACIDVYYDERHYELVEHYKRDEATKIYHEELQSMPEALRQVHDLMSSSQSAYQSNRALALLRVYGNKTLNEFVTRQAAINEAQRTQLSAEAYLISPENFVVMYPDFQGKSALEKQTLVVMLLTLLENEADSQLRAKSLLRKLEIASSRQARALVESIFTAWNLEGHARLDAPQISRAADVIKEPEPKKYRPRTNKTSQNKRSQARARRAQAPSSDSGFYLGCMLGLLIAGAALLVIALLLNPVSTPLAITGGFALTLSLGMFIGQCCYDRCDAGPTPQPTK